MALKLTKRLATALLCSITLYIWAQPDGTLKDKEHGIELKRAVHFLTDGPATLSLYDLEKIGDYNFESYRKDDSRIRIQLVKGPLIELLSRTEMHKAILNDKQGLSDNNPVQNQQTNITDEIIVQLNIGLGYAKRERTEVTH